MPPKIWTGKKKTAAKKQAAKPAEKQSAGTGEQQPATTKTD